MVQNQRNYTFINALNHLNRRSDYEEEHKEEKCCESAASSYKTPRVGKVLLGETMPRTVGRNDSTVNYDNSLLS